MKRIVSVLLAVLLLAAALIPAALADTNTTAWVYTSNRGVLNVRSSPSSDSNIITTIPYGTQVTILSYISSSWAYIQFYLNGTYWNGYVMTRYLTYTNPSSPIITPTPTGDVTTINWSSFYTVSPYSIVTRPTRPTGWVNLRWAPSEAVDVIERCYSNYQLIVIATNGVWGQAYDPSTGVVGFIQLAYTSVVSYGASVGISAQ